MLHMDASRLGMLSVPATVPAVCAAACELPCLCDEPVMGEAG